MRHKTIYLKIFLLFALMLALAFAACTSAAAASSRGSCGVSAEWHFTGDGTLAVTGSGTVTAGAWDKSSVKTLVIFNGIDAIGDGAFSDCVNLTKVILDGSISSVGDYAFYKCDKLSTVVSNSGLSADALNISPVGNYVFKRCFPATATGGKAEHSVLASGKCGTAATWVLEDNNTLTVSGRGKFTRLSDIAVLDSAERVVVESGISEIGSDAFGYLDNITEIYLPDTAETIANTAFSARSKLTAINVDKANPHFKSVDGVVFTADGSEIVRYPRARTDKVYRLPDSVKSVRGSAFANCGNLSRVDGGEISSVGNRAFINCALLEGIGFFGTLTDIGDEAFENCINLKSAALPRKMNSIGYDAFYGCTALESVTMPDTLANMGARAFQKCSGIKSISLPSGLNAVPIGGFLGCSSLETVTLPSGIETIGDGAFRSCAMLEKINIPLGVAEIGDSAFWGCKRLRNINIPQGVVSIGSSAFSRCSIEKIDIPLSLTSIGTNAFLHCSSLGAVTGESADGRYIGSGNALIDTVGGKLLKYAPMHRAEEFDIPESVVTVEGYAFESAQYLKKISMTDSVTKIGESAFENCTALEAITLPQKITDIDSYAFRGCAALKSVELPPNLENVASLFPGCASLESVTLPDLAESISSDSFIGCKSLKTLKISADNKYYRVDSDGVLIANGLDGAENDDLIVRYPTVRGGSYTVADSVGRIDDYAFDGARLSSISVAESLGGIGNYAFDGCPYLESVTVRGDLLSFKKNCMIGYGNTPFFRLLFGNMTDIDYSLVYADDGTEIVVNTAAYPSEARVALVYTLRDGKINVEFGNCQLKTEWLFIEKETWENCKSVKIMILDKASLYPYAKSASVKE